SLPSSYHPSSQYFGLPSAWGNTRTASPNVESGAALFRRLHKTALDTLPRNMRGKLSGFWTIDEHDSGVAHMHIIVSAPSVEHLRKYEQSLHIAYRRLSAESRSIKVIGAFGVG